MRRTASRIFLWAIPVCTPFFLFEIAFAGTPIVPCIGSECTACDLFTLADRVVKFLIVVGVLLATLGVMWAGFTFVTAGGDPGRVESAKKIFVNVLIGIIIALASWLIVDTIVRSLTDHSLASLQDISCVDQTELNERSASPPSAAVDIWEGIPPDSDSDGTSGSDDPEPGGGNDDTSTGDDGNGNGGRDEVFEGGVGF